MDNLRNSDNQRPCEGEKEQGEQGIASDDQAARREWMIRGASSRQRKANCRNLFFLSKTDKKL
jgi:hypothetical protein